MAATVTKPPSWIRFFAAKKEGGKNGEREGRGEPPPPKQILAYGFAMNEMHMHDMALPYTYYMFT